MRDHLYPGWRSPGQTWRIKPSATAKMTRNTTWQIARPSERVPEPTARKTNPDPSSARADLRREPSLVPRARNFDDFSNGYGRPDSWFESHFLRQELSFSYRCAFLLSGLALLADIPGVSAAVAARPLRRD
jgi:hypothetical protein